MCCACCRPGATHGVGAVMLAIGLASGALGVVLAAMWLAGVIVALAPFLAGTLIVTVVLEVAVPVYYVVRDAGFMTPTQLAREVRRAIAHDVARIRIEQARRAAMLEAARAPIATPYAIPERAHEEVARGRQ